MDLFTWAFWFRRRVTSSIPAKILQGRIQWVSRLVSDATPESISRKYILLWNGSANIAQNLVGGNFLVGLYAILQVGDALLGVLTAMIQFCNIFQILSPLLLDRFRKRKIVLTVTRIIFYTFLIIVIGLIPYLPENRPLRIGLLISAIALAYISNALASPGYSVLHIRSIPEGSRADFFSILSLINNVCIYVFILIGGYVVDFFRNRGNFSAGISAVRIIALIFAGLEIYCHCHIHEFEEPREKAKLSRSNPFLPVKNKQFLTCVLLTGLYSFFANIPGMYYSSYLVNTVVVPYSFLGVVYFLSVPCMIIFVPVWNQVIRKISWFGTISTALLLISLHYFMLPFVTSGNYLVLYTIAMVYYFSILPGINIVTSNLPFYRLPEGKRTVFLAFYASFNSLMTMLGLFTGSIFIVATESRKIGPASWAFENKQYIMPLTGLFLFGLSFVYRYIAKKETR